MNDEQQLEGIAIVGMAGRFPGAESVEEFWANLVAGRESISFFNDDGISCVWFGRCGTKASRAVCRRSRSFEGCGLFRCGVFRSKSERSRSHGSAAAGIFGSMLGSAGTRRLCARQDAWIGRRVCGRQHKYLRPPCAGTAAGADGIGRVRPGDVRERQRLFDDARGVQVGT